MKKLLLVAFLFASFCSFAQPANNNCSGAISFGTLPTPNGCGGPPSGNPGIGAPVTLSGTNVGATGPTPYTYLVGCQTGGNQAAPALDVWYSFVATGNSVTINMTGTLATPNIALWTGNCNNLVGFGCAVGASSGSLTTTFEPTAPGTTYYLQVSGNTAASTGNFNITINNNNNCSDCLQLASLTATPPPVNGTYGLGQTVKFCFKITDYNQVSSNWLHGVQVAWGPGWSTTPATLTTTVPASCSGSGFWKWYPAGTTSSANLNAWPAGFYYDYTTSSGNPGNNYGDYNAQDCDPTFCWTLTTSTVCTSGASLNVTVNTSGDGESGSWTSVACQGDPPTVAPAILVCCAPPTMTMTPVSCLGSTNGTATATVTGTVTPWDYVWKDANGNVIQTLMNSPSTSNTLSGLAAGTYFVTITDNLNCVTGASITVTQGPGATVTVPANFSVCANGTVATTNFTSSPVGATYTWSNTNTTIGLAASGTGNISSFTALNSTTTATTAVITVTPSISGCQGTPSSYTITVNPGPVVTVAPAGPICSGSVVLSGTFLPTPTTSSVTFANNNIIDIPNGNGTPGVSTVTSSGVSPTTLIAGQITSICFTIKHSNYADLTVLTFTVNGTTYSSATNTDLANLLTAIHAATNGQTVTFCFPASFVNALTGNSNTTFSLGLSDTKNGKNSGDILNLTVIMNNTTSVNYAWSPTGTLSAPTSGINTTGTVTVTATPTTTTTYVLSITNSAGCVGTANVTVVVNSSATVTVNSATICAGQTACLTASGATTYQWSNSSTGSTVCVTPVATTTYTVTGTTSGCTASATAKVTVAAPMSLAVNSATICAGQTACLTASGATTYNWSNGSTTTTICVTPGATTTYTVTGTTGGCTGTITASVTVNPLPTITINSATVCAGQGACLTATGANTYSWSTGSGTNPLCITPAGTTTYTVTGTSAAGCTSTASAVVVVNPLPTITVNSPSICPGQSACLTASGGTTYVWSTAGTSTVICVTPVATTSYTVTGTTLGCTGTARSIVTIAASMTINVVPLSICNGQSACLTASGGTTYLWSNSSTTNPLCVTPTITTSYTVTGTTGGCTGSATTSVTVNPLPTITINSATVCAGQGACLTATGATTYSWSTGSGVNPLCLTPAGTTTYTVTGTSAAGCTSTGSAVITVNPLPTITINSATVCAGQGACLTATGANTYSWSTGSGINPLCLTPAGTTTYTVTGTSAAGCTSTGSAVITVNPLPTITINSATVCVGQGACLTATGATTYSWSTGSGSNPLCLTPAGTTTYTVTGTSAAGCTSTGSAVITVNPLPTITINSATVCAGQGACLTANGATTYSWSTGSGTNPLCLTPAGTTTYTVTGTSTAGCTSTASAVITVNPLPTITINSATVCAGQGACLTATGANTYSWSTGSGTNPLCLTPAGTTTYTVTGTSAAGCTSTGSAVITVNPLPTITINSATVCAGQGACLTATGATTYSWSTGSGTNPLCLTPVGTTTYTVTGTSAAGCTSIGSAIITVNPLPTVTVNTEAICLGQTACLTASGANSYVWSTASTLTTICVTPAISTSYTVTGTSLGCTGTATTSVSVTANLIITTNSPTICIGQTACITASGGFTYSWSTSSLSNPLCISPASTTTYTVTGTNAGGCTGSTTAVVTVNPLPTITLNSPAICLGQTACITANGANTYLWSNSSNSNPLCIAPTTTTTYTVTGTSSVGCTSTASAVITVNPLPTITINAPTICIGTSTCLTASGGNSYSWSTGELTNSICVTPSGTTTYTVTGTSVNGCTSTATTVVTVNPLPTITVNAPTICNGESTCLTANGANTYTWSNGSIANPLCVTPSTNTTYTVTGTALTGCSNTTTVIVTVNPIPTITATSATVCNGTSATITASGGTSYFWSNAGETTPTISVAPSSTNTYTVTGTALGCTNSATGSVLVNPIPTVTANSATTCAGDDANLCANGATSYAWSTGDASACIVMNPIPNTTYTVTGTTNGCTSSAQSVVTVNPIPTITVNSPTICAGGSTILTANGANGYTWSSSSNSNPLSVAPTSTTSYSVTGTAAGCSASATTVVTVNALPTVSFSQPANGCTPVCGTFTDASTVATGASIASWNWNFGDGTTGSNQTENHCYGTAGSYTPSLTITDNNGCTSSLTSSTNVDAYSIPNAAFDYTPKPASVNNPTVTLLNGSSSDVNYWYWDFGDGSAPVSPNDANPSHTYPSDVSGVYTTMLAVSNIYGCVDTTYLDVVIRPDFTFYIPNAFSPNNDGMNDTFYGKGTGIATFNIYIYDRWGNLIFHADDINKAWDGKANGGGDIAQQDVYVWKVFITDVNTDKHDYIGTVTIVR